MENHRLFVSYSTKNKDFVDRLANDLTTAGFDVWKDTDKLIPGTANWEKAIREAIRDTAAIILVASPDSLQSEYVQGELTVARLYERPIYPVWASGDQWIDCVPLDMAKAQYIDGRGDKYPFAFAQLTKILIDALGTPKIAVSIGLPAHNILTLNWEMFPNLKSLLNKTYGFDLNQWYAPFTYGKDWVLGNVETRQLALPWAWLQLPGNKPLSTPDSEWGQESLDAYNILPGSYWGVWDLSKFMVVGVAINSRDHIKELQSERAFYHLIRLLEEGVLQIKTTQQVGTAENYAAHLFFGLIGTLGQFIHYFLRQEAETTLFDSANGKPKLVLAEK